MSFLSPLWLFLALVGLFILWLHLRRRTRRTQEVSSLYLWRKITRELPPQKPKEPPPLSPLLFLQLLLAFLLALALAQPVLGSLTARGTHTIYVLDASGSMGASDLRPSRFEAAKTQILREARAGRGGRVSLIVVHSAPYVAAARQTRIADFETLLRPVSGSDGPAAWRDALPLLEGLQVQGEATRVVLLSDRSGIESARAALAAQEIEARVLGEALGNLGFYALTPHPSERTRGLWRLEGHVANYTAQARSVDIGVYFHKPDGAVSQLSQTSLKLSENTAGFLRVEVSVPGPGIVELRLPPDGLEADNHAYFNLPLEPPRVRVLYLGAGNPALQKALLAVPDTEVFAADKLPPDSDVYSLVVVDRVGLERHPQTHTLWVNTSPVPAEAPPDVLSDPYPSGWQSDHPLSESLDWSEVLLTKALNLPRLPGAEVLLEAGGKPLVQARTTVYGREVALAFALQDSNWTVKSGFPIFVANLLRWAEPGLDRASYCRAGEPCGLEPKRLAGNWRLLDPRGQIVPLPIRFVEPSGESKDPALNRWLLRPLEGAFRPQKAGIYTLESDGVRYPLAVNAFYTQESDLRPENDPANPSDSPEAPVSSGIFPLWSWLLILALGVLLLEGLLAGRGEGFLSLQNLSRRNPLAYRRRGMLVLQGLAALLLLLALLDPRVPFPTRESQFVAVADRPELYVGSAKERLEDYLGKANTSPARRGLVWLGESPSLESPPTSNPGSHLQAALSLAAGMLPPAAANRVVLLADGTETRGFFPDALAQLALRGIPVDVVPVGGIPAGEVVAERVLLPRIVHAGDTFLLQGIVYSERGTAAKLRVWRDEKPWAEQDIRLLAGRNRLEATLREEKAGSYRYRLEVLAPGDPFAQNNSAAIRAVVQPATRVGIFASETDGAEIMAKALRVQGVDAQIVPPQSFPKTLEGWGAFDVAMLMNLPVSRLPGEAQKTLEGWVRDQGGGLVILGGDKSFGPGGYYQTALDRLSPLSSKVPREAPRVAMLFVMDKSGSMNQPAGQVRRIDIAKEATVNALDLLHPESLAGVVAFDARAELAVPMQSVRDKTGFAQRLSRLQPGGGTSIYPALELALQTLQNIDAAGRHVVLLTDGLSTPGDFQGIVGRIVASGITLSTVAVGEGARLDLMENIARWGGGVAHATTDWQALPAILAQEALLQSKTPVKQEAFVPVWRDRSVGWLEGFPDTLPPLGAYVQTSAKPEALVHLLGPSGDPLLASWRYGLGQVVAFASQGSGPWSEEWVRAAGFPRWWSQIVHAVLPTTARIGLNPLLSREGNNVSLTVEALSPRGEAQGGLNLEAEIAAPSGATQNLALQETAPGRYETRFAAEELGDHTVSIRAAQPPLRLQNRPFSRPSDTPPLPQPVQTGFSCSYPPRYTFDAQGGDVLVALALASGGRVLLGEEPLEPPAALHWTHLALWPLLALLSLVCFLGGLVLRYQPEFRLARRVAAPNPR